MWRMSFLGLVGRLGPVLLGLVLLGLVLLGLARWS
jgi:hypothetical protein